MQLGSTLDGGVVLGITEFAPIGSSDNMVVFTEKAQYYYDATNDVFVDVSLEESSSYALTGGDATADPDEFTVAEDLSTQLSVGNKFVVSGSTANDGTYTVASVTGTGPTTIAVDEDIPDGTFDGNMIVTDRYPVTGGSEPSDQFTVAGDHESEFTANTVIYCRDSTGNNGTYTVASSSHVAGTTTITVNEDVPDTTFDGDLTIRSDLSTSEGDIIDYEAVTDTNGRRLLMTNGVDNPLQWTGTTGTNPDHFMRWVPLYANFVTCKWIKTFKEHLFLGSVETSISEPSLIAWSDSGDFEDFTNGNAGAQILYDLTTGIQQLVPLGDRLGIYSQDAIATAVFVGLPFVFVFETIIPEGTRLASSNGIVSINVGHVYGSQENYYLFDGSRGLRTLGDRIRTDYKNSKDHDTLYKAAAVNDFAKRTIYFEFPDLDSSAIIYALYYDAFDLSNRIWTKVQYADAPRAYGFFTNTFTYTWDDTTQEAALATTLGLSDLPWSEEIGSWSNEGEQADFPVLVFGDASGNVYMVSESVLTDNGTTQDGYYETGDFTVPEEFLSSLGRWGEIEFEAAGDSVGVYVKGEVGARLITVDSSLTLATGYTRYKLPIDVTDKTLRVRFEFSGDFKLRWVRLWVRPAAPS